MLKTICLVMVLVAGTVDAQNSETSAGLSAFKVGPLIPAYGKIAGVPGMETLATDSHFKVSFDVVKPAQQGGLNRALTSGARFLNMHVANGIKAEQIQLAFVLHGGAVHDVTVDAHYKSRTGRVNANAELLKTLQQHGVDVYVCGQSAAFHGVGQEQLLPGVKLALSAMTAHALLQQQGYTLNPF